jgi:hypothetical protein
MTIALIILGTLALLAVLFGLALGKASARADEMARRARERVDE